VASIFTDTVMRYNGRTGAFINVFAIAAGLGGATFALSNTLSAPPTEIFFFGAPGVTPVTGDWD